MMVCYHHPIKAQLNYSHYKTKLWYLAIQITHVLHPHYPTHIPVSYHLLATHPLPELVGDVAAAVLIVFLAAAVRYHLLFQSLVPVCKPSHTTALPLCNAEKDIQHKVNIIQLMERRKKRTESLPSVLHCFFCLTQQFLTSSSLYQSLATKKKIMNQQLSEAGSGL